MKNNETFDFGSDEELDFGDSSSNNNDDFLSSEESDYNYNNTNTNEKSTEVSGKSKTKKTALICIVVALAIITILSIIYRAKSGDNSGKDAVPNTSSTEISETAGTVGTVDGWTQFSGGVSVEFSNYVTSSIIVTSIKNKAMITSKDGDKILKTVVSGSVSGLIGTYELEIPFTKAVNVKIGTEFKVKYRIAEYNGYRLITDMTYSE